MNTLVTHLAEACREHLLREKWLIAPSRRIAHQWLDQVTRAGFPVVNVRVETTASLGLRLLGPRLAGGRPAVLGPAARRLVVSAAWDRAVRPGGYLGSARMTPRLVAVAERTLADLRMAGLRAEAIEPGWCVPEAKGRDLQALLAAYEDELESRGYIDHADAMRLAAAEARAIAAAPQPLVIVADDLRLTGLEREFLDAFGPGRLLRLPVDRPAGTPHAAPDGDRALLAWIERPAEAPPPIGDGSVRIVHAVGEINEVREAFRACLREARPLDCVEILCSSSEPYVPLIYDTAQRAFGHDAALDLGVPVTFAEGLPARLSRPGRLLRAWLSWIADDFPQSTLLRMLQAGLLRLPADEEGDPVSTAALRRALRSLGIGFGRERYLERIERCLEGIKRQEEEPVSGGGGGGGGEGGDEERNGHDAERLRRRKASMQALRGLVGALVETSPARGAAAGRAVSAAKILLRDQARIAGPLDGLARQRLLQEIESMERALATGEEPRGFRAWEWLSELPDRLRVGGSAPRPGHVHVASIASGGHTGRGHTIMIGLDDSRYPAAGHQDPLVLDDERKRLGGALATSADRLRQQMDEFARLACRLRGNVTLSFPSRNLEDGSECFASPVVLSAWRIVSGRRDGDHGALRRALGPAASFAPRAPQECLDAGEWWLCRGSQERPVANLAALADAAFPHLRRGLAAAAARASDAFTIFDGYVEDPAPELDPRRDDGPVVSATSQLQALGACPLKYFFRQVLHVRPPDEADRQPERWLSSRDYGTLLHEVLYEFVGELVRDGRWPPEPARDLPHIGRIVEARTAHWLDKVPPPSVEAHGRQRRELDRAAEIFVNEQSHPRWQGVPVYLEAAIGARGAPLRSGIDRAQPVEVALPGGAAIRTSARIDRIDRRPDRNAAGGPVFRIWDYKSGTYIRTWDPDDIYGQGRLVQHVLYMTVAESVLKERFPGATVGDFIFLFPAARTHGRPVEYGSNIVAGGLEVIERLCRVAAAGAFLHTDDSEDCKFCDYRRACQAVNRDLKAYCGRAAAKLANDGNAALRPFVELRIGG